MFEEVEVKKMALAKYLGVDLDDIEEESWDDSSFAINPRTEKEGKPPAYWIEHGTQLRKMLDALGTDKTTWQEWASISDEKYMDTMLFMLSRHPGYNSGKYAHAESKAVEMYYKANPNAGDAAGARMVEMRNAVSNERLLASIMAMNKREFVIYDKIKFALQQADLHFEDFGIHENDLWHLIAGTEYYQWHVYAIRAAFNGEEVEDQRRDMHIDDGEYLVLTDSEADEKAKEYIEDSLWAFNPSFLACYTGLPEVTFTALSEQCENGNEGILAIVNYNGGLDGLVEEAISADGRGNFLNTYDGEEREFDFEWEEEDENGERWPQEETFYIYRTN